MTDETDRHDDPSDPSDPSDVSLAEIRDLEVEPHPDLEGRVMRDINRRTLGADSLDFSLVVMLQTFWEHLRSIIEALPGRRPRDGTDDE